MASPLEDHTNMVIQAFARGQVVTLLGAGVNSCGRPQGEPWRPGAEYLPSGGELARHLAKRLGYPERDRRTSDLMRVSEYAAIMRGTGPLYGELHSLFDADYPPTPVHRLLAALPAALRARGYAARANQLILTTNYDDVLEAAFRDAGEPVDLVYYVAEGKEEERGRFIHRLPSGEERPIKKPN